LKLESLLIRNKRIRTVPIYSITWLPHNGIGYEKMVESACEGGADIVQFRAKELTPAEKLKIAPKLRAITKRYNVPLIINDDPDIALEVNADGVHIGQDDLSLKEARKIVGQKNINFVIGKSTHSVEQAVEAEREGADYISFGPIFSTATKPEYKPVGLELLREVKKRVKIPIVAIGGINETNIDKVLESRPDAVAVISAVCGKKDIKEAVKRLKGRFFVPTSWGIPVASEFGRFS